jgi:hypothetical protein
MTRPSILATLSLALLTSAACPPAGSSGDTPPKLTTTACAKAGDRCEFAAGKIGICTVKAETCEGADCLTCVSMH